MRDDPLRMLRAVRFETTLSRSERPFAMTPDLESAIKENAGWLESISAERIREEFEKILVSENVSRGVRSLVRLGLMGYIVPEFLETVDVSQEKEFHHKDVFEHTLIVVQNVEADPILRKAAFFHDHRQAPYAGLRAPLHILRREVHPEDQWRGRVPGVRRPDATKEDTLLRPRERRAKIARKAMGVWSTRKTTSTP